MVKFLGAVGFHTGNPLSLKPCQAAPTSAGTAHALPDPTGKTLSNSLSGTLLRVLFCRQVGPQKRSVRLQCLDQTECHQHLPLARVVQQSQPNALYLHLQRMNFRHQIHTNVLLVRQRFPMFSVPEQDAMAIVFSYPFAAHIRV